MSLSVAVNGFLLSRRYIYNYTSSHTHSTQTRNNNLCITQSVAPYGNRTAPTVFGGQSLKYTTFPATDIETNLLAVVGVSDAETDVIYPLPMNLIKPQLHTAKHTTHSILQTFGFQSELWFWHGSHSELVLLHYKLGDYFHLQVLSERSYKQVNVFLLCRGCGYKYTSSHVHDTQTRNNKLWITLKVAPCGNRTRYPLHSSQLPSHRVNRAVKVFWGLGI
ncbi:hypothetical protein SFRURICE_010497 [Spodoptera frugiperda]|nr:hypothetical protein SFRURICE_010497 [Spodoptera frugiperda]